MEEKLHVVCSIDTSESFELTSFQSFFIGGGSNPASVLTGFDTKTLAAAFNVTTEELKDVLRREKDGPIVHIRDLEHPTVWTKFAKLKEHDRLNHLERMVTGTNELTEQHDDSDVEQVTWSWRKLLRRIFPMENRRRSDSRMSRREEADTFNLFPKRSGF
ncbi:hypothetical protein MLD38_009607 [Melastoma candidum]|uniref:Uncharacterized protein n=1 Tax=Melastoma candidum TaxID=119954 RepID=A0ACB9S1S3_9MYRT|nr:hypothetical protein MLD38_009607 [Melastoma candidum]